VPTAEVLNHTFQHLLHVRYELQLQHHTPIHQLALQFFLGQGCYPYQPDLSMRNFHSSATKKIYWVSFDDLLCQSSSKACLSHFCTAGFQVKRVPFGRPLLFSGVSVMSKAMPPDGIFLDGFLDRSTCHHSIYFSAANTKPLWNLMMLCHITCPIQVFIHLIKKLDFIFSPNNLIRLTSCNEETSYGSVLAIQVLISATSQKSYFRM
jgi:hypothetical protein